MNFGPFNNAAQAEIELEKIVMKDHHRAARYFIDFARASTRTQGNNATLAHAAYKGLPKRIKDSLLNFPHFKSLTELHNFVLEIDSRYWVLRSGKMMISGGPNCLITYICVQ